MIFKVFYLFLVLELIVYVNGGIFKEVSTADSFRLSKESFFKHILQSFDVIADEALKNEDHTFSDNAWKLATDDEHCDALYTQWKNNYEEMGFDSMHYLDFFDTFCLPMLSQARKCYQKIFHFFDLLISDSPNRINPSKRLTVTYKSLDYLCFFDRTYIFQLYERDHNSCNIVEKEQWCLRPFWKINSNVLIPADSADNNQTLACSIYSYTVNCITEEYKKCRSRSLHEFYHKYSTTALDIVCPENYNVFKFEDLARDEDDSEEDSEAYD